MSGALLLLPLQDIVAWPGQFTFFVARVVPIVPVDAANLRHNKWTLCIMFTFRNT
jgi:hypothetical protein